MKNILLNIASFTGLMLRVRIVSLYTMIATVLIIIHIPGTSLVSNDSFSNQSVILDVLGFNVPYLMLYTVNGVTTFIMIILLLIGLLRISELFVFGQFAQIMLARNSSRISVFIPFLIALVLISILPAIAIVSVYFWASPSITHFIMALASALGAILSLKVGLLTLLNLNCTKKMAVVYFVILFFVFPHFVILITPFFNFESTIGIFAYHSVSLINEIVSFPFKFSQVNEFIMMRSFIQYDVLIKSSVYLTSLATLNTLYYLKKDFR